MRTSKHGAQRMIQRDSVDSVSDAKKKSKYVYKNGHNPGYYCDDNEFYNYLMSLKRSNTTKVKVYDNLIYIYKGVHNTLVTVHEFPKFMKERGENFET